MSERDEPSLSISESASLERGYRRLLALYPRWFRKENEDEVLAVLMACAQDDQTRPSLEAAADLLKGAARMRLRPRPGIPRTVFAAARLMWAGAAAELAALITVIVTADSVRAAVARSHPAAAKSVTSHVVIDLICVPIIIGVWLFLAWAISRGRDAARFAFASFFLLITMSVIIAQAQGTATYAPADAIAAAAAWFVALAAVVLIFVPASNRYFRQMAAPAAHPAG
jgi:ABC-type maltose transport system permease subunit